MSENERLREELRLISRYVSGEITGDSEDITCEGLLLIIDGLIEKALAAKPGTCVWHRKTDTGGDPYGPWITSCGNEWDLQGPDGNGPFEYPDEYGFEFCPFTGCGRKIEVRS